MIIQEKKPDKLHRRTHTTLTAEGVLLELLDEVINFDQVLAYRKQINTPEELERKLSKGHTLANVGVSAYITTNINGQDYLVTTVANRTDRAVPDSVIKLVSGYTSFNNMPFPEEQVRTELAEELLIMQNDTALPCVLDQPLPQTYSAGETGVINPLTYAKENAAKYSRTSIPEHVGAKKPVTIKKAAWKTTLQHNAGFWADPDTNSGQLIFAYRLYLPRVPDLSFVHAEDRYNPTKKLLECVFYPEGIALFALDDQGRITGKAYSLQHGKITPYPSTNLKFTEAFAQKKDGICQAGSITLDELLCKT